jgi:hypothetical protein
MRKVLMVCAGLLAPGPAFAVVNQAVRDACHNDYVAHCNGMTPPERRAAGLHARAFPPAIQALPAGAGRQQGSDQG